MFQLRMIAFTVVSALLFFSTWTTVSLRCYVRTRIVKTFGTDDWLILPALVMHSLLLCCIFYKASIGDGSHIWDLDEATRERLYLIWYISFLAYGSAITLARLSIGFFFLRFTIARPFRYMVIMTNMVNIGAGLAFTAVIVLQCMPPQYFWLRAHPDAHGGCIPRDAFAVLGYLFGAVCVITDLGFCLLPLALVWGLNMPRRTKFALVPIMSLAGVAVVCPMIRMAYMGDLNSSDFFYSTIDVALWSMVESGLAITASSLATLRPLFRGLAAMPGPVGAKKAAPLVTPKKYFDVNVRKARPPPSSDEDSILRIP